MDQFIDTSSRYTDQKISNLGVDVNNLYGKTVSLSQDNKSLTILIAILVVIIVILLFIMYKVYNHTNSLEDLIWGTSRRFCGGRGRRIAVVARRESSGKNATRSSRSTGFPRDVVYESDYEEETDYESDWE